MAILTTLACVITPAGITRPSYADILATLQAKYQSIYGSDSYIDPDSQDGQLLAVFAKAVDDCNAVAALTYNAFSPSTSQGAALSNNVKLNGVSRAIPTASTVPLLIVGQVGTVIANGVAGDAAGNRWLLPPSVTIPIAGQVAVTATCAVAGNVQAPANSVNQILSPTLGWQTVNNTAAASAGAPVETDAALRRRQTNSVALPSRTILSGLLGAVQAVVGVTQAVMYENDSNNQDANGLPPHSIALVVIGGDDTAIARAMLTKKTPGAFTNGTTAVQVADDNGINYTFRFYRATVVPMAAQITIKALPNYNSGIGAALVQAVADYVNGQPIGQPIYLLRLAMPAQLNGGAGVQTYELMQVLISIKPAAPGAADVPIQFNQIASLSVADITLVVT